MTLTQALSALSLRLLPGTKLLSGDRCVHGPHRLQDDAEPVREGDTLDLADPATLGCLLELLRVAGKNRHIHVCPEDRIDLNEWLVYAPWGLGRVEIIGQGDTEGEALADALVRLAEGL